MFLEHIFTNYFVNWNNSNGDESGYENVGFPPCVKFENCIDEVIVVGVHATPFPVAGCPILSIATILFALLIKLRVISNADTLSFDKG
jgi:hypothetical protein